MVDVQAGPTRSRRKLVDARAEQRSAGPLTDRGVEEALVLEVGRRREDVRVAVDRGGESSAGAGRADRGSGLGFGSWRYAVSGHSKWHSIRHAKGVTDKRRGQLFSKLARAIIVAAKEGGPDRDAKVHVHAG